MSIKNNNKKEAISSAQIIPLGFLAMIIVGTILLWLPISTASGQHTSLLTAVFTATTSTCVTGLVVVDTYLHWSLFGKIVILILIQLGGLGIIAVSSTIMLMLHKKFSLSSRLLIMDAFNLSSLNGLVKFLTKVLKGTFFVEFVGACLYSIRFIPQFGVGRGIWYSVFTSISAFCNAGIDIIGPNSLIDYNTDPLIITVTTLLIVLGGLGYVVWFDIIAVGRKTNIGKGGLKFFAKRLSEHTKLVIALTVFLLLSGAIFVFILEYNNPETIGNMTLGDKILNSFFQSVTFRTAGFAAVPQQGLKESTAFMGCLYMFIGGSPVGTAGGVKTVTVFMVALNTVAFIRNRDENVIFNRNVTSDIMRKATAIVTVSFTITFVFTTIIMAVEGLNIADGLYEVASATATVGLSRGITPTLGTAGRIIIIICMYLGRIGPISMAIFFSARKPDKNDVHFADGTYMVG